ncbi:SAM-dependent methyltransferase [Actinoplanes sp. NPDC048791]|uniref:SAM-dependent methyltransferase n=1 Tax=Actinoplanes sp. NPDC048791 TaxID=3154623 RepID=UPI0033DDEFC3
MTVERPSFDSSTAHPARRYNYWLGGKDHFAADRESGDAIAELYPAVVNDARMNRRFHCRAVEWLASVRHVSQFLDIGCGLPMPEDNTHDIAQAINPQARVVYVDNDPLVMVHARALMSSHHARDSVDYVDADLRTPERILEGAADALDLSTPVGLLLTAVLHFLPDADNPYRIVHALLDALPAGSFLVLSHVSMELASKEAQQKVAATTDVPGTGQFTNRSKWEIRHFFAGLAFVGSSKPVPVNRWQPEFGTYQVAEADQPAAVYGGVAVKH